MPELDDGGKTLRQRDEETAAALARAEAAIAVLTAELATAKRIVRCYVNDAWRCSTTEDIARWFALDVGDAAWLGRMREEEE